MTPKTITARANLKDLRNALHVLNKVVSPNPIVPVLSNVLVRCVSSEIVSITACDLRMWVTMSLVPGEMTISSHEILLPFQPLLRLCKRLRSEFLELKFSDSKDSARVSIVCEEGTFRLSKEDLGDWPKPPRFKAEGNLAMQSHQFKEGLRMVEKSICTDDLRPAMTRIYGHSHESILRIVSTDGHALSMYDSNTPYTGPSFFLDKKVIMLLRSLRFNKASTSYISVGTAAMSVSSGDLEILCHQDRTDSFPDYMNAIPAPSALSTIGAIHVPLLRYRLSLADMFVNRVTRQGSFSFRNNKLIVNTDDFDDDAGSSQEIPCEYNYDQEFLIGFNIRFIMEYLEYFDGRASFCFNGANRGAMFLWTPKYGQKVSVLIMPVMLSEY